MQRMSLNRHWTVFTSDREDGETHDIPFFYPHDGAFSMETTFPLPAGKRFFLVYEGLLGQVKVVLNEVPQGEIEGTMTRGQFELKGPFKEENTIRLNFKQTRDTLSPGVCRYLYIESSGDIHIKKLFARGDDSGTLKISYEADGPYEEKDVSFSLSRRGRPVAEFQTMTTTFEGIALYSTKAPELYDLKMRIKDEVKEVRVGFSSTFFSEQGRFIHAGRAKRLSALTYDFEVWSAAQQRWLEVSSVSNFETFQTNRLKLRYRDANRKTQLAHTLNGSSLALPRIVAALLENNQTPEGIRIPKALVPYCGFEMID